MPLFHSNRDASLVHTWIKELVVKIIDTEVALYKLSLNAIETNMYGESDSKVYHNPIKIPALINRQPQAHESTDMGQDYTQQCEFAFIFEQLKEINVFVEVGDLIEYNGEWWELDSVVENQYFGGKNPDYSFASDRWGYNVSIIASAHQTRRSHINIEDIRSTPRSDNNDLPMNI